MAWLQPCHNQPLWLHFLELFGVWSLLLSASARECAASAPSELGHCGRPCFGDGFGLVPALVTVVLGQSCIASVRFIVWKIAVHGTVTLSWFASALLLCVVLGLCTPPREETGTCPAGAWAVPACTWEHSGGCGVSLCSLALRGWAGSREKERREVPGLLGGKWARPVASGGCRVQKGRPCQPHRAPLGFLRDHRTGGLAVAAGVGGATATDLAAGPAHAVGFIWAFWGNWVFSLSPLQSILLGRWPRGPLWPAGYWCYCSPGAVLYWNFGEHAHIPAFGKE